MLKFKTIDHFAATIYVSLPTEDPDRFNEGSFTARFKYPKQERYAEILDQLIDNSVGSTLPEAVSRKRAILDELLVSVDGIGDADGVAMAPEAARATVLENLSLLSATLDAFVPAYTGAAAKNSKPSPRR